MFQTSQPAHRMLLRYDPRIGHRFVPNLRARVPHERGGYYVVTNSSGFRSDVEFAAERGDRPRILFFGDSFTAADGCSNHERFAERVGDELGAEVFNYGLSGSGTDQQLLIQQELASGVDADLIVLCVYVENMDRIKVRYRESIDRVTGARILVPKPYFALEDGALALHNVPVPRERPDPFSVSRSEYQSGAPQRLHGLYRLYRRLADRPGWSGVRRRVSQAVATARRARVRWLGREVYPDYLSPDTPGWQLMRAILERFAQQAAPTPLLIVPLPTRHYLVDGLEPRYQRLFDGLADPGRGVHVADVTAPLRALSRAEREALSFARDPHFSPAGHERVAGLIAEAVRSRGLLAAADSSARPASRPSARRAARPASRRAAPASSSTCVLGISAFYHDSAAALVRDGEIVAAVQEERFTRVKNDRRFPHFAVNYCLEEAGIQPDDLAAVVYYDNASLTFERLLHSQLHAGEKGRDLFLGMMPSWIRYKLHLPQLIRRSLRYEGPVLQELHHRSHAASAFYPSGFDRAAILTIDGVGEWATASIGVGREREIRLLKEMTFPHSVGLLYSAFTQFTGFKVNSGEYKMMGLAPYGDPIYADRIREELVDVKDDGSIELNLDCFAFLAEPSMTNERFARLFDGPALEPDARITKREMDIAASVQQVTEEIMMKMARHAHALTGEKRLCLSGGVALNCVANGRLLREGPFEELWIQPAAGDAGSALGAAFDAYHTYFGKPRATRPDGRALQGGSYWGPAFSDDEIRAFLETHGYPHRELAAEERAGAIADELARGRVVGHLSGRTEFGPRALGSRSILGDARNTEMQVNLNLKIKYRESFRPFAPSVLAERVEEWFELDRESPYMQIVAPVSEEHRLPFERGPGEDMLEIVRRPRSDVPAITHVDYSARIQTVRHADHPEYHDAIRAFEKATEVPLVVNTSFNVRGEPIVCTPYDAYRCFMRTEMDVLVLGSFLLRKPDQPDWPEPKGHIEEHDPRSLPPAEGPLAAALGELFDARFRPLGERLAREGAVRIATGFRRAATGWTEHRGPEDPRDVFRVAATLDDPDADPERLAEAIAAAWQPGPATDALRPLLAELLRLGARFPAEGALEEQVSESVYVMF